MGILNLSPHSFATMSRASGVAEAIALAKQMEKDGADIIDIGAEPINPVNPDECTTEKEECERLIPTIRALINEVNVPISVDTSRPQVMDAVVNAGASMINDVRALRVPGALEIVSGLPVPVCLMHMRLLKMPGELEVVENTTDNNVSLIQEIQNFLEERIHACEAAGIARERLIIDPGIGTGCFGKSTEENMEILRSLPQFGELGLPLLVGVSRKMFIGDLLNAQVEDRLIGSVVLALAAIQRGANIIRVHDVLPTVQAIKLMQQTLGVRDW
ncbi:MAG: dihydropteroate synthase [Legionellales bacterium]|nr:dihydropteroate synthase [Legionellales bacterium]